MVLFPVSFERRCTVIGRGVRQTFCNGPMDARQIKQRKLFSNITSYNNSCTFITNTSPNSNDHVIIHRTPLFLPPVFDNVTAQSNPLLHRVS